MVGEFFAGLGAFKTMMDMTKAVQDAHDVATRDRAVIELQKEILSAQMAQAGLIERVGNLEKEVAGFETWAAEKKRYQLKDFGGGTFAHALKPEEANGEPPHKICTACYNKGHKSVLQFSHRGADKREYHVCPTCKDNVALGVIVPWQPNSSRTEHF